MDKRVLTSESEYANINEVSNRTEQRIKVATFCVVTKVDTDKKTLNAQPVVLERIPTPDGSEQYMKLPEILNVPYHLSDSPEIGDFCVLIHLDRGISGYTKEQILAGEVKDNGNNKHSLSNCVAICGFIE